MALNFTRIFNGLNLKPKTTSTVSAAGDIDFDTTSDKLNLHNGTTSSPIVTESSTAILTNKSIDADLNTITNIENADIKVGANIARTKLASGSAFRVVTNDTSGVMTDAAAITAARALISDANGIPTHSVVTAAELATLSGASGSVLTQTNTVTNIINKKFEDLSNFIIDNTDNTKQMRFEVSSVGTGTTAVLTVPPATTTLVGIDTSQVITNKIIQNSTISIEDLNFTIRNAASTKLAQIDVDLLSAGTFIFSLPNTATDTTLLAIDTAQVITNKDIDGGTASNTHRITLPKNTFTNINALTRKEATLIYATDQDKVYVDNGTSLVEIGGGRFVTSSTQNISNGGSATINALDGFQMIRVQGNGAAVIAANSPLSSVTPPDGTVVVIVGQSDTNTVELVPSDTIYGFLINGNSILGKNDSLQVMWDNTNQRWIELSRSGT